MRWDEPEARRLLIFTAVGVANTAACYGIYALLVHWGSWHHNPALVADYACGGVLGYAGHRSATFADRSHLRRSFGKYVAALLLTFGLNLALLDALVASRALGPLAAQGLAMAGVTLISYALQKHWVFRSHDEPTEAPEAERQPPRRAAA